MASFKITSKTTHNPGLTEKVEDHTPLQTIHLYHTQKKLLTQGLPMANQTWLSNDFKKLEQTAQKMTD